jgi:hypothetical protein
MPACCRFSMAYYRGHPCACISLWRTEQVPHVCVFWDIHIAQFSTLLMACIILMLRRNDNYCCLDNLIAMTGKPNCFIGKVISNMLRPPKLQFCIARSSRMPTVFEL